MLEKIISFSIKNKLVVGLLTLALIIWGVWSALQLPIDALPDITNNQVQIITVCPTLAGQEVEQSVTYPIEQGIANLPDLVELRSISRFGLSVVTVVFAEHVDIYFARQLINERLKEAESRIPKGVGVPKLAPVSTGLGEVYQYIIHPKKGSEGKYTAMDLRTMQDWIVARQLYGTPGIAEINSFGGQLKQYEVAVNPDRLKAMGVTIPDMFVALEKNNENTGGAYIDKKPNAYFIRGIGLVTSLEDVRNIVVKNNTNGIPILIRDVAEVRFGSAVRYGALTYNGEVDAVGGVVMMLKGANSFDVVSRVKEKMKTIQKSLPADVIIEPYLDRTDLVNRAINTVQRNLLEGALIVILVLVLFLGNLRAGLIVASAIPLSMLFALGMMNLFGVSANLMSLGAIDFGLIVDGAVIIVEATLFALEGKRQSTRFTQLEMDTIVAESTGKMRKSAAFGEIIILIVYLPILTLVGIEGKMFKPMAQTVGFAILGAMLLTLTYIPMMSALFLPKMINHSPTLSDRFVARLQRMYTPLLQKAIRAKAWVVGFAIVMFAVSVFIFTRMGGEFIPTLQEGDYAFHCILPQGTSLSQSIETSMQAARIIKQFPEVKIVVGKTGSAEVPTDPMPPEASDMIIVLKPESEWREGVTFSSLADEISEALEVIPGVFFEKNQPIQMRFNELMTGIRQDVAVKIFGENMDTLLNYANKVSTVVQRTQGASQPSVERVEGLPQITIEYNRAQMANYGLNISDVNHIISTAFAGEVAGLVYENERRFDLVVRLDSTHRSDIDDVSNLFIPTAKGLQIPLAQVADIRMQLGAAQISREAGKRRIVVGFNVKGRDVQSVVSDIQAALDREVKLPSGYYFTYGGTFENLQAASKRLMFAVPLALALLFMLLYFTFTSLKESALIFTAIPMSAIGGVFALLARDMPFSISAGVGFIALFGVAVLNGIVLISTFNQLEQEGVSDIVDRVIQGTKIRLRPVLMTATVASLGFLPMALSKGAGAEVQKPLATVVIGGLVTATFLTLFVLPLLYLIFNGKASRKNTAAAPAAILLLLSIISTSGFAQSTPAKELTVQQALNMAVQNNMQIQAGQLNVQAYKAQRKAIFELPKTSFNIQYGQYNSINQDLGFQLSQSIPFPTYYAAKAQVSKAEYIGSELQQQATVNQVKAQVLSLYYELQYKQSIQVQLHVLDSFYSSFLHAVNLRYETGETNLLEKSTAEAKRAQLSLLVKQNESEYNTTYKSLKALLNGTEDFSVPYNAFQPLVISADIDTAAVIGSPAVQYQYQQAVIAQQNKKLEIASALPDFNIGYFNQSLIGAQNVNGTDVYFGRDKRFQGLNAGISVPLTAFSNAAKVKSLKYQVESLQKAADYNKQQLQVQLEIALIQYRQQLAYHQYYTDIGLKNYSDITGTAQKQFHSGAIGYVEYLQALQTATDIQLSYLQNINQLTQSVIQINFLTSK